MLQKKSLEPHEMVFWFVEQNWLKIFLYGNIFAKNQKNLLL
jgi:hypothetical protein